MHAWGQLFKEAHGSTACKSQNTKPKWQTTLISNQRGMDEVCSRLGKRPEPEGSLNHTPIIKKKKKKRTTKTKQKTTKAGKDDLLGVRIMVTPAVLRNNDWQRHKKCQECCFRIWVNGYIGVSVCENWIVNSLYMYFQHIHLLYLDFYVYKLIKCF